MSAARRRRPAKAAHLEVAMRRELGLAPVEQLELGGVVASAAAAPIGGIALVTSPPCKACGRWNYHLVDCAEAST